MAEQFGKTWWGQQWLNTLNNIDYSNRLPRGSSYARKGAVEKITIKDNHIKARVAGSRKTPYKVDVIIPPFFEPDLGQFVDALIRQPTIISKLLNRELDPEVLRIAEEMDLKVFPKQWTDFKMQCSCPDWAVPCKHLAAVIYKISAEIDNNPFLVFQLHRVDLFEELDKRGIVIAKKDLEIPKIETLYFQPKIADTAYDPEKAYQKLHFSALENIHESMVALLEEYPVFYPGQTDFKDKYATQLNKVVRNAQKLATGKATLAKLRKLEEWEQRISVRSEQQAVLDENYRLKIKIDESEFMVSDFLLQLEQLRPNRTADYQPSIAALHSLYQLAVHLLASGAVVPQIVRMPDKQYAVRWLPALMTKAVRDLTEKLQEMLPPKVFLLEKGKQRKVVNKEAALNLLSLILTELIGITSGTTPADLFLELFFAGKAYPFDQPGEDALSGGIASWLQKYYITQSRFKPQLVIEERSGDSFSVEVNISETAKPLESPVPLRDVLSEDAYREDRFGVLQSLSLLGGFIKGLDHYVNTGARFPIQFQLEEFSPFLMQAIPALRLLDVDVLLPKSLQDILKPKVSAKLKKKAGKSFLRLDELLDFDWQVAVGDELISEEEFKKLLQQSDSLIRYKSQYIYVSADDLNRLNRHFQSSATLSSFDLLKMALSGDYEGAKVALTDEVREIIKELTSVEEIETPGGIQATLRPYQQRGYSWMYRNARIGFGSVLADDMGLGKTLQVITTIQKYKEEGALDDKKILVIAPTGLLTNWQAEIEKFAPEIRSHVYHGTNRSLKADFDVLLTSYGIARRDAAKFKKQDWHTLVIDEAQNIKNADTAQAKAVKSIKAGNFIAMSGTPVENRLSELWSIMDYSNRGFLGSLKDFRETFSIPIENYNDVEVAGKLKSVTAPFMTRRLKTDKSIISDLPEKLEINSFSTLTKEQATLYEHTLQEALKEIEAIDPSDKKGMFVRQGLVLQMIMALKQICNHPTQFLKNKVRDASLSGKSDLLFEKLETIVENNEKVLIFTQFTEMGKLLQHFITERFGDAPLFYHGGCNLKQRQEMVEAFQTNHADKIFILSLKAAGTGLNLTAANHVIHYDLWWNPAVEAQATDRAYRIGQKKNVMVHRFITKNTFEERINEMIQNKKALAEMTVSTGENWIGNLSNKELNELFTMEK